MINPLFLSSKEVIDLLYRRFCPSARALGNIHTYYSRFSDPSGARENLVASQNMTQTLVIRFVRSYEFYFRGFTGDVRRRINIKQPT